MPRPHIKPRGHGSWMCYDFGDVSTETKHTRRVQQTVHLEYDDIPNNPSNQYRQLTSCSQAWLSITCLKRWRHYTDHQPVPLRLHPSGFILPHKIGLSAATPIGRYQSNRPDTLCGACRQGIGWRVVQGEWIRLNLDNVNCSIFLVFFFCRRTLRTPNAESVTVANGHGCRGVELVTIARRSATCLRRKDKYR